MFFIPIPLNRDISQSNKDINILYGVILFFFSLQDFFRKQKLLNNLLENQVVFNDVYHAAETLLEMTRLYAYHFGFL